jgi:hypothetical protein
LSFFITPAAEDPTGPIGRIFRIAVFGPDDLHILAWEDETIQKSQDLTLKIAGRFFGAKASKGKGHEARGFIERASPRNRIEQAKGCHWNPLCLPLERRFKGNGPPCAVSGQADA